MAVNSSQNMEQFFVHGQVPLIGNKHILCMECLLAFISESCVVCQLSKPGVQIKVTKETAW